MTLGYTDVAFRKPNGVGLHNYHLSWLDHAAHTLAVYASSERSPRPTQDSLPVAGQLCRAAFLRGESKKVSALSCQVITSPFSKLLDALGRMKSLSRPASAMLHTLS